jgi:hypothetical protein
MKQFWSSNKKICLGILFLIVFNIITFTFFIKGVVTNLEGEEVELDTWVNLRISLMTFLLGVNLLGVGLGSLIALIPQKDRSYKERFEMVSLYCIVIIQILASFANIRNMVMDSLHHAG